MKDQKTWPNIAPDLVNEGRRGILPNAIGLMWSVAAMSNLVPVVDGSVSAAISWPAE
jgi:hypothetical protein